jgi:hypothetical protein
MDAGFASCDEVDFGNQSQDPQLESWRNLIVICKKRWREIIPPSTAENVRMRGLVVVRYDRTPIFRQEINTQTANLRRWKPQIVLSRRNLENDDA